LEAKAISHSLASFSFSKDTFTFDDTTFFRDDTRLDVSDAGDDFGGNEPFEPMDVDGGVGGGEDFFTGDQAVHEDYNGDIPLPDNDNDYRVSGEGEGGPPQAGGAFIPFDPRHVPNERELVLAMTGDGDGEEGGMMDYFDQNFLKNWAGPEHWKLRKVVRRREFFFFGIISLSLAYFFVYLELTCTSLS
jgi:condensin complex subunit 2